MNGGARRWLVKADGERHTFRTPEAYKAWVRQTRRHHDVTVLVALPGGADRKERPCPNR